MQCSPSRNWTVGKFITSVVRCAKYTRDRTIYTIFPGMEETALYWPWPEFSRTLVDKCHESGRKMLMRRCMSSKNDLLKMIMKMNFIMCKAIDRDESPKMEGGFHVVHLPDAWQTEGEKVHSPKESVLHVHSDVYSDVKENEITLFTGNTWNWGPC
jgi:hypothetical protein